MTDPAPAAVVTALVVTADSGPLVRDCVAALLASPQVARVLLADNASRDGEPERLAARHGDDARLAIVHSARNLGFGRAINAIAADAATPWLLIVNPDCIIGAEALAALLAAARAHPSAALVGATIVDPDGMREPASERRDPLLKRVLADAGFARGEGVNVADDGSIAPGVVEAVSGALMLVRRDVFRAIGGFDRRYFLHFEDLDLCRRVRDAGHEVLLARDVAVVHAKGSSSRGRPVFVDWHKHRSLWRWLRRHDPALLDLPIAAAAWCGIWLHFALRLPLLAARRVIARSRQVR